MKAIISSVIFLLCLIDDSNGQDQQVSLIPSFVEGQLKNYSITYSVELSGDRTEQIFRTTKKQVKIKVVAINGDLIDMQWQYGEVEFTEAKLQNNPFAVLMNTLSAGITVKYSIDKNGVINSITNRDEIKTKIEERIDEKLTSMINENKIDSSMLSTTKFQFQMMFSTPSQIDKIIIKDLFRFHQLYGKDYSNQPSKIVVDNDILPETYEIRLQSIDQSNQTCLIVSNLVNDTGKKINASYEYSLSDYWLKNHTSKRTSFDPIDVVQLYQIQLQP